MTRNLAAVALLALVVALWLLMAKGWRRRAARHDLPELVPVPGGDGPSARLSAPARYFGTTTSGDWLDRVVARGLGRPGTCTLRMTHEGVDVLRSKGPFRIPASALVGARHDQGIAGKVVPPYGVLVLTWRHGELTLDSGFRLEALDAERPRAGNSVTHVHERWLQAVEDVAGRTAA